MNGQIGQIIANRYSGFCSAEWPKIPGPFPVSRRATTAMCPSIKINTLIFLIVFIAACSMSKVELPIDIPEEAIAIAKQDKEIQEFIKKWHQDFQIGFGARYQSDQKVWLVRIFPKGGIKDVELHVIIKEDGTIINKYYPYI